MRTRAAFRTPSLAPNADPRRLPAHLHRGAAASRRRLGTTLGAAALLAIAGCDSRPLAPGDVNAIIISAAAELWEPIGEEVLSGIEGEVFTVRDDMAFRVQYQDPADSLWSRMRLLKQQLIIGTASDPWMAAAVEAAGEPVEAPGIIQVPDLWARGQSVTALVLPDDFDTNAMRMMVLGHVRELHELLDGQYREWVVDKMFATGYNTALADSLLGEHGFSLVVPEVYEYTVSDSVHIFRNDNPDPSELIRQFAVTWQSPVPPVVNRESVMELRSQIADGHYSHPQVVNADRVIAGSDEIDGNQAYTVQAVWANPPDAYPAAGPFITRAVICLEQQRMYLIDAWLYAPERDKYEYMIQLEQILGSFRCGGS